MKTILAALACLLVILSLAACGDDDDDDGDTATPTTPTTAATTSAATATPAATTSAVTPLPQNICATNPDPATLGVNVVTTPQIGDAVTSPVQVTGQIAAFEATFKVTIYDAQQNVIADQTAMSNEGQTLAPFSTSVSFTVTEDTPACLWVYEASAQDGSPIHVVQIPLTLLP